ncbi:PREDICTED: turripeptide Lol9.1-like [Ceratosolen solmsi marchali]|uniref:Turripeptide Lol9.1-like n=1 Tax=Ceratosolen solmsi marchali TaxID=326594 RepID=A0AAJ6YC54_9HYME|nr:PREDICTED: turripeptide Lol9.1-like [Ceratosolen solmsi marchali]
MNFLILNIFLVLMMVLNVFAQVTTEAPCKCRRIIEWHPVCGTDGITYANPMELICKNFCFGTNIKIAYKGVCRGDLTTTNNPKCHSDV